MKKLYSFFCLLFLSLPSLFATHNKGGEITYDLLNAATRTYRVTITTYTFYCPTCNPVPPDRDFLDSVHWGDGATSTFPRVYYTDSLSDSIRINRYAATHSYTGNGVYKIYFCDPNRNANIVNIPASVNIPFCIEAYLKIHPAFCPNTGVQFQTVPIFKGQVNRPFTHNVTAISPDWDSLSFQLVTPLSVPGYTIPGGLSISSTSGQINWNTSMSAGVGDYVVAVKVIEWKNGDTIGYVIRDFQISLVSIFTDTLNVFAPLSLPQDVQGNYFVSVNPGDTVNVHAVYYGSSSNPPVTGYGGAFYFFNPLVVQSSSATTTTADLTWIPTATQSRRHPYIFTLRGSSTGLRQTDATFLVYVNGVPNDTCIVPIGFNEVEEPANKITVFPNPVTDELVVMGSEFGDKSEIEIYNLLGEKVLESHISSLTSQISVNVSHLPSGIYFVKVKMEKGISATKFVKE